MTVWSVMELVRSAVDSVSAIIHRALMEPMDGSVAVTVYANVEHADVRKDGNERTAHAVRTKAHAWKAE
ncbi:hypothetical protein COOONC_04024 [Cooperia oncophora]